MWPSPPARQIGTPRSPVPCARRPGSSDDSEAQSPSSRPIWRTPTTGLESCPKRYRRWEGRSTSLVNNAAAAIYQNLADYPLRRRRLSFEVNVHAPMDLAQAVLPPMLSRGEGWVVNVSSATARPWRPPFHLGALGSTTGVYGASKAALNRMTNALAAELAGRGVRINTVEPRAAVMSEGAAVLTGSALSPDQIESMEQMVEAIVALCDCDPERTGLEHVSLDLIAELGLTVCDLEGKPIAPA
jgi:citronellol/citronellal dehydrogenase